MSAIGVTGVHPTTNAVERLATESGLETIATALGGGTPVEKVPTALGTAGVGVAVGTPGTAVTLAANSTFARAVWLTAKRTGGANTGNVYLGDSLVDKTTPQQTVLEPGDYWEFVAPVGVKFDLNDLYIDADTATDGVTGGYIPA